MKENKLQWLLFCSLAIEKVGYDIDVITLAFYIVQSSQRAAKL